MKHMFSRSFLVAAILAPVALFGEGVTLSIANFTGSASGPDGLPVVTVSGEAVANSSGTTFAAIGRLSAPAVTAAEFRAYFVPAHISAVIPALTNGASQRNGLFNAVAYDNPENSLPAGFSAGDSAFVMIGNNADLSQASRIAVFQVGVFQAVDPVEGLNQSFTLNASSTPLVGSLRSVTEQPATGSGYANGVVTASVAPAVFAVSDTQGDLENGVSVVDFGALDLGVSTAKTFSITNSGSAPLTGVTYSVVSGDGGDFVVETTSPGTINGGQTVSLTVRFSPGASGNRNSTLSLSSNETGAGGFELGLTGRGNVPLVPEIAVLNGSASLSSGNGAAFGSINRGSSKTISLTVRNTGTANLTGIAATLAGTNVADFTVVSSPPATLAPNASAVLSVMFTPSAAGPRSTTLRIISNDSDENPFSILLSGSGVNVPEIAVLNGSADLANGSSLAFGDVDRGSDKTISLTVRNTGTANLTGIAATIAGTNVADFTVVSSPPTTLAPNASAVLSVKFTPSANGARSAALHIVSNDADENPFDIALSGNGTGASEIAVLRGTVELADGSSLVNFGRLKNGTNKTIQLTVKNTGKVALRNLNAAVSGAHAAQFRLLGSLPATLEPGASATLPIRFVSANKGARRADLRIASDDSNENPFDIRLQGVAIPVPEIAVLRGKANLIDGKSKLNFGSVASGKQKVISLVIRNTGTGPLTKLAGSVTGRDRSQFRIVGKVPKVLNPRKSAVLRVVFRPANVGRRAAGLVIRSNDANENPFNISLSGAATKAAKTRNKASTKAGSSPAGVSVTQSNRAGDRYLVITIEKDAKAGKIPLVEVSSDRVLWMSGDKFTKTLLDNAATLKVRDRVPTTAEDKRYIRVRWLDR